MMTVTQHFHQTKIRSSSALKTWRTTMTSGRAEERGACDGGMFGAAWVLGMAVVSKGRGVDIPHHSMPASECVKKRRERRKEKVGAFWGPSVSFFWEKKRKKKEKKIGTTGRPQVASSSFKTPPPDERRGDDLPLSCCRASSPPANKTTHEVIDQFTPPCAWSILRRSRRA